MDKDVNAVSNLTKLSDAKSMSASGNLWTYGMGSLSLQQSLREIMSCRLHRQTAAIPYG